MNTVMHPLFGHLFSWRNSREALGQESGNLDSSSDSVPSHLLFRGSVFYLQWKEGGEGPQMGEAWLFSREFH